MDVKQLIIEPQIRSPWQVFDLAVRCYRLMWLPLCLLWLIAAMPLALLLALVVDPWIAGTIIWLCKPLLERPLLHYVSRAVFSEQADIRSCLRALATGGWWQALLSITWYRFAWRRAFLAPVLLLEQQTADARQQRCRTLTRLYNDRQGFWLMFCVHLELLILVMMLLLGYSLLPAALVPDWLSSLSMLESNVGGYLILLATLLSYSVVAPLFVLGGFLMYINRRIVLEAWDLELKFRKIAVRLQSVATLAVMLLCLNLAIYSQPLLADTEQAPPDNTLVMTTEATTANTAESITGSAGQSLYSAEHKADIKQQVEQIYQQHELLDYRTRWVNETSEQVAADNSDWLSIFSFIADSLGVIGWLVIIAVTLGLLYWLYQNYHRLFRPFSEKAPPAAPTVPLMFADLPAELENDDLLAQAAIFQQAGNARLMTACLLRYALHYIQQHYPVKLSVTMTEQECLHAVNQNTPGHISSIMARLIDLWIAIAWAHQQLTLDSLGTLLQQLETWPQEQSPE
ncbi:MULTISPECIES: hypothetical protein [unclassified Arsukibacterium]|uniref:hypothetical protein n=1 Tax=unclassified Arsukibacterium TaxID=2635278 RepID=UPI000C8BF0EF|nr:MULTISPECIES: hypothetical protein [unclassified Arsukibacterium]MAA95469.1 hypothetical protein [Rheinheimera sp.]HAW94370.1 hypothetical protein [Candidatus Azambacteria bacterium]